MSTVIFALTLLLGAYLVAVIEGWTATGRLRPAGPARAGLALLGRESIVPRRPDRLLYEIAPPLVLVVAVLSAAVLPLAPDMIAVELATGALFVNAAWAYVMVALVMAGWGPNSDYAMVAGWRFLGQAIAYGMLIVMPIAAVAMRAESLATTAVVESQGDAWNLVTQPLGFILFLLAALALAFLPPLDLAVAPGELAGGVMAEYSGMRLAVFRLGRLILVLALSGAVATFYLGGWLGPALPDWAWMAGKTLTVAAVLLAAGRFIPRIRQDDLFALSWKVGIPLALVNIAWVGITLWLVDR